MSDNVEQVINFLQNIFKQYQRDNQIVYAPFLSDSNSVTQIIQFLDNPSNTLTDKITILVILNELIQENTNMIPFFIRICKINKINFYFSLINLYLSRINDEYKMLIEKIIKLFNENISLSKSQIEFMCQKLSKYYYNKDDNVKLDENLLLNSLHLLKLFYISKDDITQKLAKRDNSINSTINISNKKQIKNYIYFNGIKSSLSFEINKNSINSNSDFPTLENGLSFIFWIFLDENLLNLYKQIFNNPDIILININMSGSQIKLCLIDMQNFEIILTNVNKKEKKISIHSNNINYNGWNNIAIIFHPKHYNKSLEFKLYINASAYTESVNLDKDINDFIYEKLDSIVLFKNFIGKVTSVLFSVTRLEEKNINYIIKFKYGFYKNKYLYDFICSNEKNYFSNCTGYLQNNIKSEDNKFLEFNFIKQNIKNLITIFCPFAYNQKENKLDDICGNFTAILGENDGVNFYENKTKYIKKLGGINNLLPIIELMHSTISNSNKLKYINVDKSILTQKTFYEYLLLLKNIFIGYNNNYSDANNRRFFSSLSLFLEKFPKEFFTKEILEIFLEIGKEEFSIVDKHCEQNEKFLNNILLNEKIISQFNYDNQLILWKNVNSFFISDDTQIKEFLNITKFILILRYYDRNRYQEFCCKNHAEIFDNDEKIMNPEFDVLLGDLFNIILLFINKLYDEEENANLFKLLSMDLSPCMQKKIIDLYISHFENEKLPINNRIISFELLLKNNFCKIIEYIFSISLIDVKIEIIKLIKLIMENKDLKEKLDIYYNKTLKTGLDNFDMFISENLLLNQLFIEAHNNNMPLVNYINKNIYNKNINNFWCLLSSLMITKMTLIQNNLSKKSNKEIFVINEHLLNFCIKFVSKSPVNYIDVLLYMVFSFFKDESIINREVLYKNKDIYLWLIETIFLYHNDRNKFLFMGIENLDDIQKKSLELFGEIFSHRRPHDETINRINYIFRYSYKLRKNNLNNFQFIKEISKIMRLLLKKIMDISPLHMNYKTKIFFEFMIFYKNVEKITGINQNNNNANLLRNSLKIKGKELTKRISDIKSVNIGANTYNAINAFSNTASFRNSVSTGSSLIPKYIFDGLNYEEKDNGEINNNLKEIWKDFIFYDSIIDYYSSNIWGIENLRKKVKLDFDGNILSLCEGLIREYGGNKNNKNILYKEILKLLNVQNEAPNLKIDESKIINLLNINAILLSISIEVTNDDDEKNFLINKLQQFIIFNVLCSININLSEINHEFIQDRIYDCLGFSLLVLKKTNNQKYKEIINYLISPIFKGSVDNSAKKNKTFTLFKKNTIINIKNTAFDKLFDQKEKKEIEELEENDDIPRKTYNAPLSSARTSNPSKNIGRLDFNKTKTFNDDYMINKKDNPIFQIELKAAKIIILKNVFDNSLDKYIDEVSRNSILPVKNYYNSFDNNENTANNFYLIEKHQVNKTIIDVLEFYDNQIKNYANKKYILIKNKRKNFKKNKTKLFSWRGFWSDRDLFYSNQNRLKLKTKNYFTKEMYKPILIPVLDIEYFTPNFKKFDTNKLFNSNDCAYKINLDIDDILQDETEENIISEINTIKNKDGFNYLECLYKLNYENIWKMYNNYHMEKFNFDKIISLYNDPYNMLITSRELTKKQPSTKSENIYNCCIVKLTHHITGYISTEKSNIRFFYNKNYFNNEETINENSFDKEMQCCFGSFFQNKKNDKDKINITIDYNKIKYIFFRQYFYTETALEIYTESNKSYFLNFTSNEKMKNFTNDILSHFNNYRKIKTKDFKGKKALGYERISVNAPKKNYYISNKFEEWQNNNISNFEFLMWLNIYSGRSFNDLTQYPVFPWIITNYSDELNIKNDMRNLCIPIGMLDLNEKSEIRKETFIETYETLKNDLKEMFPDFSYTDFLKKWDEYFNNYNYKPKKFQKTESKEIENFTEKIVDINQLPYFYGSHYSNPTYVSHFLSRIFPYSFIAIEIQGEKFDDPDRIFSSTQKTFESVCTAKDDVRELIPEFYTVPEIFKNVNNLNLTQGKLDSENKEININDVILPNWCNEKNNNNLSANFVIKLRRILEMNDIKINKWIDLIFGILQRGEKAEENHNIFKCNSYDQMIKIENINDIDSKNALMRLYEMGVSPFQIFDSECKAKLTKKKVSTQTIDESKKLTVNVLKSYNLNICISKNYENNKFSNNSSYKIENKNLNTFFKILKIKYIDNEKLKIFTNTNQYFTINYKDNNNNSNNNTNNITELNITEESNILESKNNSTNYCCSYLMSDIDTPCIIYNSNQYIVKGGFWDGRLEINSIFMDNINNKSTMLFSTIQNVIVVMEMSKNEKILFCGTLDGYILGFRVSGQSLDSKGSFYLHSDEITSIVINENLNLFASSGKDGYVNICLFPSCKLIRSFFVSSTEKNKFLYADNVFLSSNPLPCFSFFISLLKKFKSYTINGEFITENLECDNTTKIICPKVYTNNNFQDILIYGTDDGFVKLRKFPEMEIINKIQVTKGERIQTLELSFDHKYCFAWSKGNIIYIIKDSNISNNENDAEEKLD